jgi:hypothetical protein
MTTLRLSSAFVVRPHKLDMADLQCLREFEESNDRRIAAAALEAAQILLTEAGTRFDFLLGEAFSPTQARKVSADQFAHVHALPMRIYTL